MLFIRCTVSYVTENFGFLADEKDIHDIVEKNNTGRKSSRLEELRNKRRNNASGKVVSNPPLVPVNDDDTLQTPVDIEKDIIEKEKSEELQNTVEKVKIKNNIKSKETMHVKETKENMVEETTTVQETIEKETKEKDKSKILDLEARMVQYQNQLLEYQSLLKEHQTREALDSNKIVLDTVEWERKYILLQNEVKEIQDKYETQLAQVTELERSLVANKKRHSQLITDDAKRMEEMAQLTAKVSLSTRKSLAACDKVTELNDMIEMLTLDNETLAMDKEIAEESMEELQMQMESQKVMHETMSTNGSTNGGDGVSNEEVIVQNEKLRTAIKTLHDRNASEKLHLTRINKELEMKLSAMKKEESLLEELTLENSVLCDEKQELTEMLDLSSAYESMVEQVTEKNLVLGDKVAELEANVSSLESLLELSEEMEESHVEYENELLAETEILHVRLRESKTEMGKQTTVLLDKEHTISQFRHAMSVLKEEIMTLRQEVVITSSSKNIKSSENEVLHDKQTLRKARFTSQAREIQLSTLSLTIEILQKKISVLKEFIPTIIWEKEHDQFLIRVNCFSTLFKARQVLKIIDVRNEEIFSKNSKDKEEKLDEFKHLAQSFHGIKALLWLIKTCDFHTKAFSNPSLSQNEYEIMLRALNGPYMEANGLLDTLILSCMESEGNLILNPICLLMERWRTIVFVDVIEICETSTLQIHLVLNATHATEILHYNYQQAVQTLSLVPLEENEEESLPIRTELDRIKVLLSSALWMHDKIRLDLDHIEENTHFHTAQGGDILVALMHNMTLSDAVVSGIQDLVQSILLHDSYDTKRSLQDVMVQVEEGTTILVKRCKAGEVLDAVMTENASNENSQSVWKVSASDMRRRMEEATTLRNDITEAERHALQLSDEIRTLEKEVRNATIVREKAEEEATRLRLEVDNKSIQVETAEEILLKERKEFDKTITEFHLMKENIDTENRQLKKQMKRTETHGTKPSRKSIGGWSSPVPSQATAPQLVQLQSALSASRKMISHLRSNAKSNELVQLPPLPPVVVQESSIVQARIDDCKTKVHNLASEIALRYASPILISLGHSDTPPKQQFFLETLKRKKLNASFLKVREELQEIYGEMYRSKVRNVAFGEMSHHSISSSSILRARVHIPTTQPRENNLVSPVSLHLDGLEWQKLHAVFA